jgi:hypothetical protein
VTVVVATRFTVSSAKHLPRFLAGTIAAARQARQSPGYAGGRLRIEPFGAFWTLTAWQSGRDMVAFRDSGVHAVLVPRLAGWAGEAVFGVWNADTAALPTWPDVSQRVAEHPNFASVEQAAPAHRDRRFDPARRFGLDLPVPRTWRVRRDQSR